MDETLVLPPSLRIRILWVLQKLCGSCSDTASLQACRGIALKSVLVATLPTLRLYEVCMYLSQHVQLCRLLHLVM